MPTRYQQLRSAIANLAAPAHVQRAHLESIFRRHGAPLPPGWNTDELALEFDGIYSAAAHMQECGELAPAEIDAAAPLDALLEEWSGREHADFWTVAALFDDPRWEQVRQVAREALAHYPDELRESDFTRQA